jgi:hypothetical protein
MGSLVTCIDERTPESAAVFEEDVGRMRLAFIWGLSCSSGIMQRRDKERGQECGCFTLYVAPFRPLSYLHPKHNHVRGHRDHRHPFVSISTKLERVSPESRACQRFRDLELSSLVKMQYNLSCRRPSSPRQNLCWKTTV